MQKHTTMLINGQLTRVVLDGVCCSWGKDHLRFNAMTEEWFLPCGHERVPMNYCPHCGEENT